MSPLGRIEPPADCTLYDRFWSTPAICRTPVLMALGVVERCLHGSWRFCTNDGIVGCEYGCGGTQPTMPPGGDRLPRRNVSRWLTTVARSRWPRALTPQHAEADIGIVERDPLNDAVEYFPVGQIGCQRCGHRLGCSGGAGDSGKFERRTRWKAWVESENPIKPFAGTAGAQRFEVQSGGWRLTWRWTAGERDTDLPAPQRT